MRRLTVPGSSSITLLPPLTTYSVSPAKRRSVVEWFLNGLRTAGARVLVEPTLDRAPFVLLIELPETGERLGIVAYLFTANSRETRNRPKDEARFQIKYGSKEDNRLHEIFDDPHGLWATLLWGVDVEHDIAVSCDPAAHNPTRMFRSVFFKKDHITSIRNDGWHVWDRDRDEWTPQGGEIAEAESATTEVLVGATQRRVLDLVLFERAAKGFAPAYRHLLADSLRGDVRSGARASLAEHDVIRRLGLTPEDLLDMIGGAPRLFMAVRGWAAQRHLGRHLLGLPMVAGAEPIERDGEPDFHVRLRQPSGDERAVLIECKNTLRGKVRGLPKVDFQRTRAPQGDPCGRFYSPDEFDIVAACLHPVTGDWEFRFRPTASLARHRRCAGRLDPNVLVDASWTPDLAAAVAAL
jgi:hypothetical protein